MPTKLIDPAHPTPEPEVPQKQPKTSDKPFIIESDNIITIAGMRGMGKSELARHIFKQFTNLKVWDPLGQYTEFDNYVPTRGSPEEFDAICKMIWDQSNVMFAVEECESVLGERMALTPYSFKIILQGRNRGIGLIAITRRIALLNKTVFSLSDHAFLFRFFAPNDVKYCQEFIGRQWAFRLQKLPKYHFIYYGAEGEIRECPPISI